MNQRITPKEQFYNALSELAKACNANVGMFLLQTYEVALAKYGYDRLIQGLSKIVMERQSRDPFPSINDIKEAIGVAEQSDDGKAAEAATRLCTAISRFGYPGKEEDVRPYVGELGWYVVKMHGGWSRFCESTDNLQHLEYFRNTLQKEARAYLEKSHLGCLALPPGFSESDLSLPGNKNALAALGPGVTQSGNDNPSLRKALAIAQGQEPVVEEKSS